MRSTRTLFLLAVALVALGVISFALQSVVSPKPDTVCVDAGRPSSGFVDGDKSDCPISQKSYEKFANWESSPKPFRIMGSVLILAGLIVGVVATVRKFRGTAPPSTTPI